MINEALAKLLSKPIVTIKVTIDKAGVRLNLNGYIHEIDEDQAD